MKSKCEHKSKVAGWLYSAVWCCIEFLNAASVISPVEYEALEAPARTLLELTPEDFEKMAKDDRYAASFIVHLP